MATDLKIENGHLILENGDLSLTREINCLKQQVLVGLHLLVGDWVLNINEGIDYFGGMRAYPEILSAQIKHAINTVEGVDTVLKYTFYIDKDDYYHVICTIKVGNSEIVINENITPVKIEE